MKRKIIMGIVVLLVAAAVLVFFTGKDHILFNIPRFSRDNGEELIKEKFPGDRVNLQCLSDSGIGGSLLYKSATATFTFNTDKGTIDTYKASIGRDDELGTVINLDQAIQIAESAVRKYRPDFDLAAMTRTATPEMSGDTALYRVEWRLFIQHVDIGHFITVDLLRDGTLYSYEASNHGDYHPNLKNIKITKAQAVNIAKDYLLDKIASDRLLALKSDKAALVANASQGVCWTVTLSLDDGNINSSSYTVILDAASGKVINDLVSASK